MSASATSDADPLQRFRESGDRLALSALFERHRDLAYRVALRVLHDPADAEDAAQDAFLRLLAYEPRVRLQHTLSGLVAKMACCAARDIARREGRRRTRESLWNTEAAPQREEPNVEFAERELQGAVLDAVEGLADSYRLPVLLHYLDGLSTRETAEALGISQTAVTTRLSRALARLREHLGREGAVLSIAALATLLQSQPASAAPATLAARLEGVAAATGRVPEPGAVLLHAGGSGVLAKLAGAAVVVAVALGGNAAFQRLPPPPRVTAADWHGRSLRHGAPVRPPAQPERSRRRGPAVPAPRIALGVRAAAQPAKGRPVAGFSSRQRAPEAGPAPPAHTAAQAAVPRKRGQPTAPPGIPRPEKQAAAQDPLGVIVASLRDGEQALQHLRGSFVYEKYESAASWNASRKALIMSGAPGQDWEVLNRKAAARGKERDSDTRSVCAGQFMAGPALFRLDGVMINDGGPNGWGIAPRVTWTGPWTNEGLPGAPAMPPAPLRTIIVRDGRNEVRYSEADWSQKARPLAEDQGPQDHAARPSEQWPLSDFLFGDGSRQGLSRWLSRDGLSDYMSKALPPAMKRTFDIRFLGREELGVMRCAKVETSLRRADPETPGAAMTYWLAELKGYAPVMYVGITWHIYEGRTVAACQFWLGEGHQELLPLVPPLVLPTKVRVETALGYPPAQIDCHTLERCEFLALDAEVPVTREDVTRWTPPLWVNDRGGKDEALRQRCWIEGQRLLQNPGPKDMHPRFREFILQQLQAGPPPPLAP